MKKIGLKIAPPPFSAGSRLNQAGFTLIELMIVVGIIGILVSLAGPQYNQYKRKTHQAEAKLELSSVYALEKAFYSEYSAYVAAFDAIGYSMDGSRRFYWNALAGDCVVGGLPTGFSGTAAQPCINVQSTPYAFTQVFRTIGNCTIFVGAQYPADAQAFVVYAQGNLGTPYDDLWTMNNLKILSNCSPGI